MSKNKKVRKILIMGLPGAGKTYLAKEIYKHFNAIRINGDEVRKKFKDWDFTKEGRIRQAKRLNKISNYHIKKGKNVVVDFICPNKDSFKYFKADFIIWMDTIKKGRHIRKHLDDINPIFRKPKKFNLRVTSKDAKLWKLAVIDLLEKKRWNNKKPTAQMLGRYQPWHLGHRKLFECIVKKDLQVNIQVKDSQGLDNKNPFSFKKIKKIIYKDLIDFKYRIKITKVPNVTNIFYGRKVGYKIKRILTPKKFREISATKIRSKLKI